jgi:NAD/NADP transhydrogenase beta subunit
MGNFNGASSGAGCAFDTFTQNFSGRQRGGFENIARGALSGSSLGVVPGYGLAVNSAANAAEILHKVERRNDETWMRIYKNAGMTEDQAFNAIMFTKADNL